MATTASIGIIGGSGLYTMPGFTQSEEVVVDTPYGAPSDALIFGDLNGVPVVFLPRHGRGHRIAPHEINYRANIWALKKVGVRWLVSVSAVGSLREDVVPGQFVLVDQFIDRTRVRPCTFFEDGIVGHVAFAHPCCETLRGALKLACEASDVVHHDGGAYVCIEGPQFSTQAESHMYRSFGATVVGMTNFPEARLAREAEIAYATLAMATDYDCWHPNHESVTVEAVVAVIKANVSSANRVIADAVPRIANLQSSAAHSALKHAIMTAPKAITAQARERLAPILAAHHPIED